MRKTKLSIHLQFSCLIPAATFAFLFPGHHGCNSRLPFQRCESPLPISISFRILATTSHRSMYLTPSLSRGATNQHLQPSTLTDLPHAPPTANSHRPPPPVSAASDGDYPRPSPPRLSSCYVSSSICNRPRCVIPQVRALLMVTLARCSGHTP